MIKANDNRTYYGITVYRIFGKKKDLEQPLQQLEHQTVLIDSIEQSYKSFISFQSIESIDTGILTEVWSHIELVDLKYYYDGIYAEDKIITLKRGDIIEFIGVHRILTYFKVMASGLKRITIDQSMIKKTLKIKLMGGCLNENCNL